MSVSDLVAKRNEAAVAYYEGNPTMTDDAFDALTLELEQSGVEQEVGHGFNPQSRKVSHAVAMLSLDKVRELSEIEAWLASTGAQEVFVQHKYDGLSVSIHYDDSGVLESAATRGNGWVGEDVTDAVLEMARKGRIPSKLPGGFGPAEIRGEVMVTHDDFERLNAKLLKRGLEEMANARNAAAGILRRLDTKDAGKYLSLFVFDHPDELKAQSLVKAGFNMAGSSKVEATVDSIESHINSITEMRHTSGYDIDGIVIKVASRKLREQLGNSRTAPRWAVAYKFPNTSQETILRKVFWSTGRTGRIVPVAVFDPISLSGATVTQATLHNYEYLKDMKLRLGDTISVTRSNEVIPYVNGRVGKHPEDAERYKVPMVCPNCGEDVRTKGKDIVCTSGGACNVVSSTVYSLTMVDVLGVSSALIIALRASGKPIRDVIDLLSITKSDIAHLDGFGDTSAENAISSLRVAFSASLESWIAAIGIPNIGYSTAQTLVENYRSLAELGAAKLDDLTQLPGIGYSKAEAIIQNSTKILEWALRLEQVFGFSPLPAVYAEPSNESILSGKNIVLTGKLPTLSRSEAAQYILQHGSSVQGSVSKSTDLLVSGERVGTKMTRAQELGIDIMTGEEFEAIVIG